MDEVLEMVPMFALFIAGSSQSTCRPPGADGIPYCCPFYFLKNNTCEECPPGYSFPANDVNCSLPCSYPSYGALCESRCDCSKEDCHHVYGCHVTSTNAKTRITTSLILSTLGTTYKGKYKYNIHLFFVLKVCHCV
nr:uncharacterized protein LOC117692672 [Crassostrea gigas]